MRCTTTLLILLALAACSDEASQTSSTTPDAETGGAALLSTPLAPQPQSDAGGPRFVRVDAATSGLDFANQLFEQNVVNYVYSGAGGAVGDYDKDGLPDVYLVSQDGPNRLFRQVAPLRFEDVTERVGKVDGGAAWGTAASFADVDGDGDLDLYVCNLEAPNLLYQNRGDGTFVECAGKFGLAVVAASTGAAFADYDNDGDLDLYVLTNRVFGPTLPQGMIDAVTPPADTRKTLAQMFPPQPRFTSRDGKPIVPEGYEEFFFVLKNQVFTGGQPDRLLRNDGYARWTDVTESLGMGGHGSGLSACWWDCDGDGWLDLYVANDLESPDRLWRNRGDGTFEDITQRALPHTAYYGMGCDFGDIDNDGRFDFCVADMASRSHYMSKMLMGSMSDKRWFLMNAEPPQHMRNALFVNSGTERFLEAGHMAGLASTDWTWTVRFADLDDDGWLDFYATNGMPRFDNDPDVGAEFKRLWRLGARDEALELARSIPAGPERNVAKRNLGGAGQDLAFEDVAAAWGLDELGISHGALFSDLDRDGDLDLIVNHLNAPASLFENRGDATRHRILVSLRGDGARDNHFGVGATVTIEHGDQRQTRLLSLARGYMSACEPVLHFGVGSATAIDRLHVRWPSGREQEFRDLAADRHYTVTVQGDADEARVTAAAAPPPMFVETSDAVAAARHSERDFDDYALQPLLPHRLSRLGPGIAVGDVDRDGRDDLWCGGAAGQAGQLLRSTKDGFAALDGPWSDDDGCEDMGGLFLDHDSDGDLDLYVVSGGIEAAAGSERFADRLYVNGGDGTFTAATDGVIPDLRHSGSAVCASDFDHDGDIDLFVGGRSIPGRFPQAAPSALLRNDEGRFVDVTRDLAPDLAVAGMVTSAVWADVDDDGFEDLAVAAQWQPVRVFANRAGAKLEDVTSDLGLDAPRGLWNGIATADLDNDGDLDFVVTNLGLNSKYHANPEHPYRVYADDFDGDGVHDVVEAKYEGDNLLPVRGRSCSSNAMPFIAQRFRTFDSFARASLTEIYGDARLSSAQVLAADQLAHVILENRNGTFLAHPLPRRAQLAPAFGIAIEDFDADGWLDIALAQNFDSPEPETGRMAGGVSAILRGRGNLQFDDIAPDATGIVIPDDAMALATLDLDEDSTPDLVFSVNDHPARAFTNCATTHHHLAVRLRGPAGNPTAIGARVDLLDATGALRARRRVTSGSGYLSASSATLFFPANAGTRIVARLPGGEPVGRDIDPAQGSSLTFDLR